MTADGQYADAVAIQLGQARLCGDRDGHHLARDGVAILEARGADRAGRQVEPAGDLADEVFSAHAALLDPEVEIVALAAGLVGGDFFDLKVFWFALDASTDAGQVGGPQRRRGERVESHDGSVGGDVIKAVATARKITSRRGAEKNALERSEKMKKMNRLARAQLL